MPGQRTTARATPKTTPAPPSYGPAQPRGGRPNGNRGNGKPLGAWPVELVLSGEVEVAVEGKDGDAFGFAVCSVCASLLPGSEVSRALHARWHDTINAIDQRAG